ncbi:hypothetical protein Mpe_A2976 [Methylibium petroleiphilum PM1]|uniref:Uncharacterized protein n=1 Tax=Methylibium petroleiphilum (strain ATCC BAA-1232 / LMG 22953 / PM1) TaxID=420662 RepID=A2SK40_METPP|nr:hypothetical protein Mpe_A2976 [Methylibium petroleiphilum PM1]
MSAFNGASEIRRGGPRYGGSLRAGESARIDTQCGSNRWLLVNGWKRSMSEQWRVNSHCQEKRASPCEADPLFRRADLVRLAGIEPTTPWFVVSATPLSC